MSNAADMSIPYRIVDMPSYHTRMQVGTNADTRILQLINTSPVDKNMDRYGTKWNIQYQWETKEFSDLNVTLH